MTLDVELWHQHASGEVISCPLRCCTTTFGVLAVEPVLRRVIDDVLELVHHAESLAGRSFSGVQNDYPACAVLKGHATAGEIRVVFDSDARQIESFVRERCAIEAEMLTESSCLQLGDLERRLLSDVTLRYEAAQECQRALLILFDS